MRGTLRSFDSLHFARYPLRGFERDADIRRELKIDLFVLLETAPVDNEVFQRQHLKIHPVNEERPQCHHPELEYYTKQLRSADEEQTVFYECPQCRHKFSINT